MVPVDADTQGRRPGAGRGAAARGARLALSLAVAVLLLALLARWGGFRPADLRAVLARLPLAVFLQALLIHLGIYLLRSWRFRLLIPGSPPPTLWQAFVIGSAHNLATYVLPAKTGEATWVVYLRTQLGVPGPVGLASLLLSRLLDLGVLCGGLAAACLLIGREEGEPEWLLPLGAALVPIALMFLWLAARGDLVARVPARILRALGAERLGPARRLLERADRVAEALRGAAGGRRLLLAGLLTAPQWLGIFAFHAVLALSMGLPQEIGFAKASFGASLAVLSNLLPVNGLAGFGTQEAGWVLGFHALGVERDLALAVGIGVHLVQLLDTVALGLVGHFFMGLMRGPDAPRAPGPRAG